MDETSLPPRIEYIDVLRVLSMLAVVFLHNAAGTLRTHFTWPVWHFTNVLTSLMTASVPLFFMISGAVLLRSPKTASVAYTLKKRVPRILIPFLVWSLLAIAYYAFVSRYTSGAVDWKAAVDKLKHLPAKPTAIHLWFMYALIPLYIVSPFLKKLVDGLGNSLVAYLLGLWGFFSFLLPTVAAFLPASLGPIATLDQRYNVAFVAGYAGYFVAGYYLMRMKRSFSVWWPALVAGAAVVCIALGTWWKTAALGQYSELFKTYTGVFVVVLSCSLFLVAKEALRRRRLGRVTGGTVRLLAPLAFGVYLVHNLLVDAFSRLLGWWPAGSIRFAVAGYLVVLAASVALVLVLSHLGRLSYVFTGQAPHPRGKPKAGKSPGMDR